MIYNKKPLVEQNRLIAEYSQFYFDFKSIIELRKSFFVNIQHENAYLINYGIIIREFVIKNNLYVFQAKKNLNKHLHLIKFVCELNGLYSHRHVFGEPYFLPSISMRV
jgi:hypothetical protein